MTTILALDISGNFEEGKGTTGVAFLREGDIGLGTISSTKDKSAESYWGSIIETIDRLAPEHLVVEGYRLYHHKGKSSNVQANSILETPQLLGVIRYHCFKEGINLVIQYAKDVKTRWSEDVLCAKGYLEKKGNRYYHDEYLVNTHMRDALKHLLHFEKYKLKEVQNG
ncbi:resolvase [Paenibacillus phage SV21]|nr:resolvase [Paenibacillus phage SV21]